MNEILVLYYSKSGSVKEMASLIARGINSVDGAQAKIRTVPEVFPEEPQFLTLGHFMSRLMTLRIALGWHSEAQLALEI